MRGASWEQAVAQSQQIKPPSLCTNSLIADMGVIKPVTLLTWFNVTIRRERCLYWRRYLVSSSVLSIPVLSTPIWMKSTSASRQGRILLWCSKGPTNTIGRVESSLIFSITRPVEFVISVVQELASPSVWVRWWRRRSPGSLKHKGQPGKVHSRS